MKRTVPILLAILLGAVATAVGMGVFLKLANDDRAKLGAQIETARAEAEAALRDKEQIASDANQKVQNANDEVAKAQKILQALEEERQLLADAKQLLKPSVRETRGWQTAISLPLGVSLLMPQRTDVQTNNAVEFVAIRQGVSTSTGADPRWFSLTPYQERMEAEGIQSMTTSTPTSYLVNGRLLIGHVGTLSNREPFALFRVQQAATSTHLLWVKESPGFFGSGNGLERFLGALEFAE
jgi:hypothetical protein